LPNKFQNQARFDTLFVSFGESEVDPLHLQLSSLL
jgi:hypothetical protein